MIGVALIIWAIGGGAVPRPDNSSRIHEHTRSLTVSAHTYTDNLTHTDVSAQPTAPLRDEIDAPDADSLRHVRHRQQRYTTHVHIAMFYPIDRCKIDDVNNPRWIF